MPKFDTKIEIPFELLESLLEDRLVVFCGAGISYYDGEGLPLFPKLVQKAFSQFNQPLPEWDTVEQKYSPEPERKSPAEMAFERGFYDRALEHLENSLIDPSCFRKWLIDQFIVDGKHAPNLRYHKALLKLMSLSDGRAGHRIITTNVDNFFDLASEQLGIPFHPLNQSPLPMPDPAKWKALTYLHGCAEKSLNTEGQELVFTSSDFAKAYLLDGWATRFITEIFREYTVLFIGYGVDDPLVTYLMDGLNSQNKSKKCFAFADFKGKEGASEYYDSMYDCHERWKHKKITPILFNTGENGNDFSEQLVTLENWAEEFKKSPEMIAETVSKIVSTEFKNDDENSRNNYRKLVLYLCQDMKADTWTPAQQAFLDTPGHISWLEAFDTKFNLYNEGENPDSEHGRIQLTAGSVLSKLNPLPIYSKPQPETLKIDEVPIAGWTSSAGLSTLSRLVLIWLRKYHLDKIELVKWVAQKGGRLHPDVGDDFKYQLEEKNSDWAKKLDPEFFTFWKTVLDFPQRFKDASPSMYYRSKINVSLLLNSLRPCLGLREKSAYFHNDTDKNTPFGITSFDLEIANLNFAKEVFDDFKRDEAIADLTNLKEELHHYAPDFTDIICQSFRLLNDLPEGAKYRSYFRFPRDEYSLSEPIEQQVFWAYHSCLALYQTDPKQAKKLWMHWVEKYVSDDNKYFEDVIYMIAKIDAEDSTPILPISLILKAYNHNPYGGFSDSNFMTLLRLRGADFTEAQISKLIRGVEKYGENPEYFQNQILLKLYQASPPAKLTATQIEQAESYQKKNDLREDFKETEPSVSAGWVAPVEAKSADGLSAKEYALNIYDGRKRRWKTEASDILRSLTNKENLVYCLEVTNFYLEIVAKDPNEDLHDIANWCWNAVFDGVKNKLEVIKETAIDENDLFDQIPEFHALISKLLKSTKTSSEMANGFSYWLRALSDLFDKKDDRSRGLIEDDWSFWELWDKAFKLVENQPSALIDGDPISSALNSGSGRLCEALISRLNVRSQGQLKEIPDEISDRLKAFLESSGQSHQMACVFISLQMMFLCDLDRKWVDRNVVPLMDIKSGALLSTSLWQGYLWNARLNKNMWPVLKPLFERTLKSLWDIEKLYEMRAQIGKIDDTKGSSLGDGEKNYYALIISVLMAQDEMDEEVRFTPEETRQLFKNISTGGMNHMIRSLISRVEELKKIQTKDIWKTKVSPWFERYWPTDKGKLIKDNPDDESFDVGALVRVLLLLDDEFPNVFNVLKEKSLLFSIDQKRGFSGLALVLRQFIENPSVIKFPNETLELLNIMIDEPVSAYERNEVSKVLDKIVENTPSIESNLFYTRLRRV
ncbi:SIR2 family protein [Terasakiella pusilla]|uniref:SIR2 family protein n=1 Tax=Terasakiella pusilla TaxID=64973 RepID=UPI003AA7B089